MTEVHRALSTALKNCAIDPEIARSKIGAYKLAQSIVDEESETAVCGMVNAGWSHDLTKDVKAVRVKRDRKRKRTGKSYTLHEGVALDGCFAPNHVCGSSCSQEAKAAKRKLKSMGLHVLHDQLALISTKYDFSAICDLVCVDKNEQYVVVECKTGYATNESRKVALYQAALQAIVVQESMHLRTFPEAYVLVVGGRSSKAEALVVDDNTINEAMRFIQLRLHAVTARPPSQNFV